MTPVNRTRALFAVYDFTLVVACTLLVAYIHDGPALVHRDIAYLYAFLSFPFIWVTISFVTRKFRIGERSNHRQVLGSVLLSNFVILSVLTILMVMTHLTFFSRFIFFGTVAAITLVELFTGMFYVSLRRSVFLRDWIGMDIPDHVVRSSTPASDNRPPVAPVNYDLMRAMMTEEAGDEAFHWISRHIDITDPANLILSTDTRFNILNYPAGGFRCLVNLRRINHLRRINKFFEAVNSKLPDDGIYIGCAETYTLRKQRILSGYFPPLNYLVYLFDFLIHRVCPKLILTRKAYFLFTRGKRRVLSKTETIGRLYSCGFELAGETTAGGLLYWIARKTRPPYFDDNPTYGVFIRLRRIGKDGREFSVYKLRTMHAYAEYIQHYIHSTNDLGPGGKFRDDFRVTTLGRFLRRFWLDELPMLLNVLKGEMKLVGVRPLSRHYFNLYTPELQHRRTRTRPGLIPPFYAWYPVPATLQEVQQNESEYLEAWEKRPFATDVRYFFKALYNILIRRARSG